MNQRSTDNINV